MSAISVMSLYNKKKLNGRRPGWVGIQSKYQSIRMSAPVVIKVKSGSLEAVSVAPRRSIKLKKGTLGTAGYVAPVEEPEPVALVEQPKFSREDIIKKGMTDKNNWSKKPVSQSKGLVITSREDMKKALLLCEFSEDTSETASKKYWFSNEKYYIVWRTPKRVNVMECKIKSEFEEEMDKLDKKLEESLDEMWNNNPDFRKQFEQ